MEPLVSIVIPMYNAKAYVLETLLSVARQQLQYVEVIIVDDGSADTSQQLVKEFILAHNFQATLFVQPNRGASAARNTGIAQARGKYILPFDSDDILCENFIPEAVRVLENDAQVKVVTSRAVLFGEQTGPWELPEFSLPALALRNMLPVCSVYRKTDWERVGGYCTDFPGREDWDFWIRILKDGGTVVKLPLVGFQYRMHATSKRNRTRKNKREIFALLNKRHPEFFTAQLNGPLRLHRKLSKPFNTIFSPLTQATPIRKLAARIISGLVINKIARHRVRGLIEFGLARAIRVARQNRTLRNKQSAHYLSVCAIVKNEGPYFTEWIEWHRAQGVDKFYLYDNESTDDTREILKPYTDSGLVEYHFIAGRKKQTEAYDDCLARHRYDSRWIAFIDLDEFIVPVTHRTIPEFLKEYEKFSAVEINWLCYGSGGAKAHTPGTVMERFRKHAYPTAELNRHIKSIVNPRLALNFISSHHPTLLSGYAVDANGCKTKQYFFKRTPLHDKIRINHYAVKSYAEFLQKRSRGRGMSLDTRALDYFEKFDRNEMG